MVHTTQYQGLLVWRRLDSFVAHIDLFCSITTDSHLSAVNIFLQTPCTAGKVSVFLTCSDSISMTMAATTLWGTGLARCRQVSFSHVALISSRPPRIRFPKTIGTQLAHLTAFLMDTHLAFCPQLISFTMTILLHSPLKVLSIQSTGFSSTIWSKLLFSLTFPQLRNLSLDCECPLATLLLFLECHPCIDTLNIGTCRKKKPKSISQFCPISLPSLHHLGGPAEYLCTLAKHIQLPRVVRSLAITLRQPLA